MQDYDEDDVFNADELGLFYKLLPSKTLAFKGKKLSNGSLPKDRVSLLVGANMSGTEKLPLLMIGRYQKPRCLVKVKTPPIKYRANMTSWMKCVYKIMYIFANVFILQLIYSSTTLQPWIGNS